MQPDRPLVTIGIPTYNRASGRLGEAIRGALAQTYPNIEIVISDNCSTDNTTEIVNSFNNKKIHYIRQETNIGPFNNFNACLENARGEYFHLFHDDDQIDEDFIESCMAAAHGKDNIGLIRSGIRLIDGDGNIKHESLNNAGGLSANEYISTWLQQKTSFYFPCTLFNTKKLIEVGGLTSPHDVFCDAFAIVNLVARYNHVDVREVKASFRRHDENMGASVKVLDWCYEGLDLIELICSLFPELEDKFRTEGNHFFCLKNYRQTQKMSEPLWRKTLMYFKVRKMFDNAAPLWPFYREHELSPIKQKLLGRN